MDQPKELTNEQKQKSDVSKVFEWTRYDAAVADLLIETEKKKPHKLLAIFDQYHHKLTHYAFWYLLSVIWTRYPDPNQGDLWGKHFLSMRPYRTKCIMKPSEKAVFNNLPPTVMAFRPFSKKEMWWIDLYMDDKIARSKAIAENKSELALYRIPKDDIIAYFNRRSEKQIIVFDQRRVEFVSANPVLDSEIKL